MDRTEFARRRLLQGNFLLADELTQEQYELVTGQQTKPAKILALYDSLTGANLSRKFVNPLDDGPFFCLDEGEVEDTSEGPEFIENDGQEPILQPLSA